ncbi:MAG: hypothetical protein DME23_13470 [Verrucomicrobia bacterium]|nr:MAG: hypothetical protein DME23_13470 [Verrucomicrobiota bacterium]
MQADGRWAKARELMRKLIEPLATGDRVALVDGGAGPNIISPLAPPAQLKPRLDKLQPGFGAGDLGAGLRQAVKLLSASATGRSSVIYVISDLQPAACEKLADAKVPQDIEIKILSVGEPDIANLAVSELSIADTGSATVGVSNFSSRDAREVEMELVIDGDSSVAPSINVAAGAATNLVLPLPDLPPGWHTVEARIHPGDGFGLDDTRYQSLYLTASLRVLCVEQRPGKHGFEQETYFLATALAPMATHRGPYLVTKVAPDQLASELESSERCALVILPGLRQVPADMARALRNFVTGGGGMLMFLGDGVSAGRYDSEFQDLLPATLEHPEGERELRKVGWHLGDYDKESVAFSAFRASNSGDLSLPEFTQRFAVAPLDSCRIAARFNDQMPFVVANDVGKGRIVMVNTSADTSWTDWPKRKTFVPWLHGLAAYATSRSRPPKTAEADRWVAEEHAEIDLGGTVSNRPLKWREPNGIELAATSDVQGRIVVTPGQPGLYSVRDAAGRQVRPVAVNLPASESDLKSLNPAQVQQQIARADEPSKTSSLIGFLDPTNRELWRVLLGAGLVLLLFESLLANRTFA